MDRKRFLNTLGLIPLVSAWSSTFFEPMKEPDLLFFKDDGKIPNSKFPLLLYHDALPQGQSNPAHWLKTKFAAEGWTNSWINGIYPFHHYHSTSHEVLGIYSGSALLHLGGEHGEKVRVVRGDLIVIPAGVGHKKIDGENLGVVGAYPDGRDWDLLRGTVGERPKADKNIAALPIPTTDPWLGSEAGLTKIWK